MQQNAARSITWLWLGLALIFATCFAWQAYRSVPNQLGIDLWQPWGVATVRHALPGIGNPYVETRRYGDFLHAHAGTPKLSMNAHFWAGRSRSGFEPTGTPLFYALFRALPVQFDRVQSLWAMLLYAFGWFGTYLVARARGRSAPLAIALATAAVAFFLPLSNDAAVANVNALQLALMAAILHLLVHRPEGSIWSVRTAPAFLVLLVAFKPNTLPVACAIALHLCVTEPREKWAAPGALASVAGIVAIGLGVAGLGSSAWADWWRYIHGMNGGTLLYSSAQGNQAPARMLADVFPDTGVTAWSLLLCASLACLVALVAIRTRPRLRARAALADVVRDPGFAMAAGVVLLFAAAPLVWYHYYVFALLPIVWWASSPGRPLDAATGLALASALLFATPIIQLLLSLSPLLAAWATYFAWLPLAAAMLLRARPHAVTAAGDEPQGGREPLGAIAKPAR